ncbi:hypothetical protein PR003_g25263 [Phytophthora rubi]|uniref:HTH CENPB-type domain-containing protein n=1 Tax=Phytophthora rubi TaxID=129364 RepID=A0A6A4CFL3_9STRA|nr:hypothetical protein PR002_g24755 [Phytophthora rubi]KAE8983974.1 hypothetical protein PR001_g23305 [Phytophthora rubi]KAE9290536.1 hypothetical protein PR003_g25263 [Phytophthora rubi]
MSKLEEEQLVRWVNELRADGVPVTSLMLKLQEIYQARPRPRVFRASWSWQKLFLRRHRLPIRRKTREGQTTPEDALLKAAEFSEKVRNKMKELGIAVVYNADQTGVNYEYVPTATVNRRGEKTVWVKCAGKTRERVTAMLLAASDGTKCDPFLVIKTRPSTKPEIDYQNKVVRHGFGRKLWSEIAPLQEGTHIYGNGAG